MEGLQVLLSVGPDDEGIIHVPYLLLYVKGYGEAPVPKLSHNV